jgi:GNAT superfamily N-acetyltransferase
MTRYRPAAAADAPAVARLHAESWQRHYRGAFSDGFLDARAPAHLLALWTRRLAGDGPLARTYLAQADDDPGEVLGFVHVRLGDDEQWGSLVDNLHVAHGRQRQGAGSGLMALAARAALGWSPGAGLYLWVLEQNAAAQAFYAARGGACTGRADDEPPAGDPANLVGRVVILRYAWPDPSVLLSSVAP